MAELKPIVLTFPTRGASAVDYIDYFDEGHYGPDKPFFVGRFDDLKQVAAQMHKCLSLQTTPGSMIHGGVDDSTKRLYIEGKWGEPLTVNSGKEPFPYRAQYKIRFMIRIKFYGEFAYIDLGAKWQPKDANTSRIIVVTPDELEVVDRCMVSREDAKWIRDQIVTELKTLGYDGTQSYNTSTGEVEAASNELTQKLQKQIEEDNKIETSMYVADSGAVLSDGETLITIE